MCPLVILSDRASGAATARLYRLMDRLCRKGPGIIVTSGELPELPTLCDRILVLCEGHVTGELSREEASKQRRMELATQRPAASPAG